MGLKLDPSQVPRIYKTMALHAGVPADAVAALAGHSTRVGPVQDMIACGIELPAILPSRALAERSHGPALRRAIAGPA